MNYSLTGQWLYAQHMQVIISCCVIIAYSIIHCVIKHEGKHIDIPLSPFYPLRPPVNMMYLYQPHFTHVHLVNSAIELSTNEGKTVVHKKKKANQ